VQLCAMCSVAVYIDALCSDEPCAVMCVHCAVMRLQWHVQKWPVCSISCWQTEYNDNDICTPQTINLLNIILFNVGIEHTEKY